MNKKKMLTSEPYGSIKSCPFCGWGTIVNASFLHYRCQCNACGAATKEYKTWESAIKAWNRRSDAVERKMGKWNAYYHGINETPSFTYSCNQCGYNAPYGLYEGKYSQKEWNFCPNCGAEMKERIKDE